MRGFTLVEYIVIFGAIILMPPRWYMPLAMGILSVVAFVGLLLLAQHWLKVFLRKQ